MHSGGTHTHIITITVLVQPQYFQLLLKQPALLQLGWVSQQGTLMDCRRRLEASASFLLIQNDTRTFYCVLTDRWDKRSLLQDITTSK